MAAFVSTLPLSLALSKTCLDNAYAKSQNKEKERGAQTKHKRNYVLTRDVLSAQLTTNNKLRAVLTLLQQMKKIQD